jgi:hypothetical protein
MLYPVELRAPALFSTIYSNRHKGRLGLGTDLGPDLFNSFNSPPLALVGRVRIPHRGVNVGMPHHRRYRVYGNTGIRSPGSKCVTQIMEMQIVKPSITTRIIESRLDVRYIRARLAIGENEFARRPISET